MMWKWLQPRYNLNFYTHKSLDECKNILIENGEKGIKPENNPSNMWLRGHKAPHKSYVIIHDKINSATFQIDVHSPDVMIEFHITGTMTPEKDGTRVRGSSRMAIIEKSALILVGLQILVIPILPLIITKSSTNLFLMAFAVIIGILFVLWLGLWASVFFQGDKIRKLLGGLIEGETPKQTGR